jgi:signal peptidase II
VASPRSLRSHRTSAIRWLALAALLTGLDQLTKLAIINFYALGEHTVITSWLNIVRVHNTGAAFSFLADAGGWQRWFFVGLGFAAVGLLTVLMLRHASQTGFALAASLIISGAIGNTIDRLSWGHVIDFIDLHAGGWHWPAFNIADSCIVAGAALLVLDELRRVRRG